MNTTIIHAIKNGDPTALGTIYKTYRTAFIGWLIKNWRCELEVAKEIYQITVVTFYDNVVNGKFTAQQASIKTYLFAIGKNKMLERKRQEARMDYLGDYFLFEQLQAYDNPEEKKEKEKLFLQIEVALKALGNPCKTLLEDFYYFKCNLKSITEKLKYKNENTAKNAKYKCLQRLKKSIGVSTVGQK